MHALRPLALLLALAALSAHAQTSVRASVDRTRVDVGERVTYTLEIRTGDGDVGAVSPPAADGLRLVQPQPTRRVFEQGPVETRVALSWAYEAARPGTARFAPLRVPLGGRTLTTGPIEVTVVPGASAQGPPPQGSPGAPPRGSPPRAPATAPSDLFIRAQASSRRAFVGEQTVVDYVLYFADHLQPRQTAQRGSWDAAGFWREELDVPVSETYPREVTIGGRRFGAVTIRRVALFPTRAGALTLAPLRFQVDLLRTTPTLDPRDPFGRFFSPFSSRFAEEEVTAPGLEIEAAALPPGAPDAFSGAVGQFGITAEISHTEVAVGEPVEVRVRVRGSGNVAALAPPAVDVPAGWDAYRPRDRREVDRRGALARGTRTFTFTFVPQEAGTFQLPPAAWAYYDVPAGRYETLRPAPFSVVVGPAPGEPVAARPAEAEGGPLALRSEARWRRTPGGTAPLGLALGLAGVPLAALALWPRSGRRSPARPSPRPWPWKRRRQGLEPAVQAALTEASRLAAQDPAGALRALDAALAAWVEASAEGAPSAETSAEARALRARLGGARFRPAPPSAAEANGFVREAEALFG